jgi:hypothetical protein
VAPHQMLTLDGLQTAVCGLIAAAVSNTFVILRKDFRSTGCGTRTLLQDARFHKSLSYSTSTKVMFTSASICSVSYQVCMPFNVCSSPCND